MMIIMTVPDMTSVTMCSLPEALMVVSSFWFSWLDPNRRKQTSPTWVWLRWMTYFIIQPHLDIIHDPEPGVCLHPGLKLLGQPAVVPDILLQTTHSKVPDDEPELERAEPPAKRNAPMLKLFSWMIHIYVFC